MRTPSGPTSSVLIIKVSFIQGLEPFKVTCLGPRDTGAELGGGGGGGGGPGGPDPPFPI